MVIAQFLSGTASYKPCKCYIIPFRVSRVRMQINDEWHIFLYSKGNFIKSAYFGVVLCCDMRNLRNELLCKSGLAYGSAFLMGQE